MRRRLFEAFAPPLLIGFAVVVVMWAFLPVPTLTTAQTVPPVVPPYHVNVPLFFDQPVTFTSSVSGIAGGGGTGPAGPPGPAGPVGPVGPQGPPGTGTGGTAAPSIVMVGTGANTAVASGPYTSAVAAPWTPIDPKNLSQAITIPVGHTLLCLATAQAGPDATGGAALIGIMDGTTVLNHAHLSSTGAAVVPAQIKGDGAAHTVQLGYSSLVGHAVVWNGTYLGGLYPMLRCDLQ